MPCTCTAMGKKRQNSPQCVGRQETCFKHGGSKKEHCRLSLDLCLHAVARGHHHPVHTLCIQGSPGYKWPCLRKRENMSQITLLINDSQTIKQREPLPEFSEVSAIVFPDLQYQLEFVLPKLWATLTYMEEEFFFLLT